MVLNPGTVLGRKAVIYAGVSARGVIAANHILKLRQSQVIVHKDI